jgi:magnesium transporter
MSVVAAYRYRKGVRIEPVSLDTPPVHASDPSDFIWIGLVEPSEDMLRQLQTSFDLHPLSIEDALQAHELPKLDIYGNQLFVTMRTARLEKDEIIYGETSIFAGRHHIISVRHGSNRSYTNLRTTLEASPDLLTLGIDYVLHAIVDYIVDGYVPIVSAIEDDVLEMERQALDNFLSRDEIRRLFDLRRELIKFHRVLDPTFDLVRKLANIDLPCIDKEARPYFSNVLDHINRIESKVHSLQEILKSVFETSMLLEQKQQSVITRQLASWAAILAVPTAIAGIYGMNFKNMPELETQYGYYVVIFIIVTSCSFLFWRFKRAGWI